MERQNNLGYIEIVHTLNSTILPAYKQGIKSYNERAKKTLDILSDWYGELKGSNCFAPIKLREYLSKETRLADMRDLIGTESVSRSFSINTGLILRTAGDIYSSNDFLAKDLTGQLNKRNIFLNHPKVIYFDALDLRKDNNSYYGLAYKLNERAELGKNIIDASELVYDFGFTRINKEGIPIPQKGGTRCFRGRYQGLSGFSLNSYFHIYADDWILQHSDDTSHVVVVSSTIDKGIGFEKNSELKDNMAFEELKPHEFSIDYKLRLAIADENYEEAGRLSYLIKERDKNRN